MAIKIKASHKGRFTAYKKRTGKTTAEALRSKDPHVRQMANFARMAKRHFKKLELGGPLGDLPKDVVNNNLWRSHTAKEIYPVLAKKGLMGSGRDSIPESVWLRMPASQRASMMSKDKGTDWTMGGPEGYRLWNMESIPQAANINKNFSGYYLGEKKKTAKLLKKQGFDPDNYNPFMADTDVPQYSVGGWLKDNAGNLAKIGVGAAMTATGIGAPIGASLMTSGAAGALGSIGQPASDENEISEVYKPAVSRGVQQYDNVVAAGGMNLKKLSKRTDYIGEQHNQGGINLPIGVQVEDGESRTGDIVHSDKIKVTPAIMKRYGGNVPFKRVDIGKSVADVVKKRDKRFEKRTGDQWNDETRKVSQLPFEEMSDELSQIYDITQRRYFGAIGYGKDGLNLKSFLDDPGNAPIIGSGIGMATNLLRRPEKVDYQQASFTPTQVAPISSEAGIQNIKRSFGSSRERLRRLNPRGYMNNLSNIAASEAEAIGSYTGQIQAQNAETQNRASMMDSQNRSRLSMFNTQVGMQEAEANAANRGARKTAIDANTNQLFTQIGQKSRDDKMMTAQEDYQNQMIGLKKQMIDAYWGNKDKSSFVTPEDSKFDLFNLDENEEDLNPRNSFTGRFGGNLRRKTTALLGKRRYRKY